VTRFHIINWKVVFRFMEVGRMMTHPAQGQAFDFDYTCMRLACTGNSPGEEQELEKKGI
jgi:hypothetical protein